MASVEQAIWCTLCTHAACSRKKQQHAVHAPAHRHECMPLLMDTSTVMALTCVDIHWSGLGNVENGLWDTLDVEAGVGILEGPDGACKGAL